MTTLLSLDEARAQAELALANLTNWQQEQEQPIESLDRECLVCGLAQPDDDSTDCWACGAVLDPDDIDPDAEMPQELRCTVCGCPANVFFTDGDRLCWDHLQERAEAEKEKDAIKDLLTEK